MSAEHVELARLIIGRTTTAAVEGILAAGYRKPQQITTVEELDALRIVGTAIEWGGKLYGAELAAPGDRPCWFGPGRATATVVTPSPDFPATVLHVGGADGEPARSDGWQDGYSKGYQDGYAEGVSQVSGYDAGYNHGYVKALNDQAKEAARERP